MIFAPQNIPMFLRRNLGGNTPQIKYLDVFYTESIVVGLDVISPPCDPTCIVFGYIGGNLISNPPTDWDDTIVGFYGKC